MRWKESGLSMHIVRCKWAGVSSVSRNKIYQSCVVLLGEYLVAQEASNGENSENS